MTEAEPRLRIGIAGSSVMHRDGDNPDIGTRFRMVREAGVFDYVDKTPLPGEPELYRRASEAHGVPLLAGNFYYTRGRDEPLLEWHLRVARSLGTAVHNVQLLTHDAEGRPVSDDEVAQSYLEAAEAGERLGVMVCFEVHVNMWSENFARVARVAERVARRGAKFRLTLDVSHVVFKMDNAVEQRVQGLCEELEAGRVILDPFTPHNVCAQWIDAGLVRHVHARPAVPANPLNVWARHPDGSFGRGIQYPFRRPQGGEWHSPWSAERLAPWKEAMRYLFTHHAHHPTEELPMISTEIIPFTDYGAKARYSLFDDSVALAAWLRETWASVYGAATRRTGP